jgi:hypothetical protein
MHLLTATNWMSISRCWKRPGTGSAEALSPAWLNGLFLEGPIVGFNLVRAIAPGLAKEYTLILLACRWTEGRGSRLINQAVRAHLIIPFGSHAERKLPTRP